MSKKVLKKTFEVQSNETIDQCLDRIKNEGYMPIRRTEKPIFEEIHQNDQTEYKPVGRQIVFEAKLLEQ
ncbi:NETI motif-containing protein [Bacillus sp. 03113]|uniref:NETI motif-containing protein n=1 Tax=Bacillus sp. 03113 TaxID=2578211 RepID=UPI001143C711|nr:NETI motif-containing protein [Bacillus sp. 03113]